MWGVSFVFVSNKSGWLSDSTTHTNLKIFGLHLVPVWGLTATPKPSAILYLALLGPTFAPPPRNHFFTDTPLLLILELHSNYFAALMYLVKIPDQHTWKLLLMKIPAFTLIQKIIKSGPRISFTFNAKF